MSNASESAPFEAPTMMKIAVSYGDGNGNIITTEWESTFDNELSDTVYEFTARAEGHPDEHIILPLCHVTSIVEYD